MFEPSRQIRRGERVESDERLNCLSQCEVSAVNSSSGAYDYGLFSIYKKGAYICMHPTYRIMRIHTMRG